MYIVYCSILYYIKNNVIHDTVQEGYYDPQTPPMHVYATVNIYL